MKKPTNWDVYFEGQMCDPEMRGLVDILAQMCFCFTQRNHFHDAS